MLNWSFMIEALAQSLRHFRMAHKRSRIDSPSGLRREARSLPDELSA